MSANRRHQVTAPLGLTESRLTAADSDEFRLMQYWSLCAEVAVYLQVDAPGEVALLSGSGGSRVGGCLSARQVAPARTSDARFTLRSWNLAGGVVAGGGVGCFAVLGVSDSAIHCRGVEIG